MRSSPPSRTASTTVPATATRPTRRPAGVPPSARLGPWARVRTELSETGAPVAALVVLVSALGNGTVWPRWPISWAAILLGLELATGPLARRLSGRSLPAGVRTGLSFSVLGVLVWALVTASQYAVRWPEIDASCLLGAGILLGELPRRAVGERTPRGVLAPVVLASVLGILLAGLADPLVWPRPALRIAAVLLAAGLLCGPAVLAVTGRRLHMAFQIPAAVLALAVLVFGLAHESSYGVHWPAVDGAVVLGIGLAVVALLGRVERPEERRLAARVDELSRTRRGAIDVQANELRRIERDLHDGAQARLVALSMKLGRAEDRFADQPAVAELLRDAREDAAAAVRELRELARGIAPPVLTDRGLEAAVASLAQRSGADVRVRADLARRPQPSVETAAYFVVAESLTNAAKHAAGARVEVRLDERGGDLFVEVTDFGSGGADPAGGGLTGLRQRVEALDGALHVTSPDGVGTQIEAVLPCGR